MYSPIFNRVTFNLKGTSVLGNLFLPKTASVSQTGNKIKIKTQHQEFCFTNALLILLSVYNSFVSVTARRTWLYKTTSGVTAGCMALSSLFDLVPHVKQEWIDSTRYQRRCVQQRQARTLIVAVWSQCCHKSKIKLSWQMEYKVRGALWNKIQKGKYLFLFFPPVGCNQFWGTEYKVRGALWNKIQKVEHLFRFLPPVGCNQFCES